VYFGFRNNYASAATQALYPPTGIYSYNITTGEMKCLIPGVSVYGLAVNNNPSKLF
jgi:hypothetical protein